MHECPRKEVTFCCITDPRTVILVSVRHGDVFWQRFCDVLGISFLFLSLFFTTTTDIFPCGRLALHGHVSTTNAPVDSVGGEGRGRGYVAFPIWSLSALVRQSDVKRVGVFFFPPLIHHLTSLFLFLSLRGLRVPRSPRHPVHPVPFLLCSENVNISFSLKRNPNFGCAGMDHMSSLAAVATQRQLFFFFLKVLSSTWR